MNAIPIIGWALSLVLNTSMAVPFWIIWTVCGIGEKYFYFVPEKFLAIPFWDCVGIFVVIEILKSVLTPRIVNAPKEVKG